MPSPSSGRTSLLVAANELRIANPGNLSEMKVMTSFLGILIHA